MTAEFFTRSKNDQLFNAMVSTIKSLPYKRFRVTGMNTGEDAVNYLHYIFELSKEDWLINIDEDAYVSNPQSIPNLIEYMEKNNYQYCGFPDGGTTIRFHNPLVVNPFFNIFNMKEIRKKYNKSLIPSINAYQFNEAMKAKTPTHLLRHNYVYDRYEPFYGLFLWMIDNFNCYFMDSYQHSDTITTVLKDEKGQDFLYHTWYSRCYGADIPQTNRINNIIRSVGVPIK
jgi:hypothetical protein